MRRPLLVLIGLTLAANAASQAYAIPVTRYIRYESTSVTTDLLLRFGYFAFMLVVAFVEALLLDEWIYRGDWRRRFLGGQGGGRLRRRGGSGDAPAAGVGDAGVDPDELLAQAEAAPRAWRRWVAENSAPFFLAFLALLGANYFLFNALNGGFDRYYARTGHLFTQLRSPDEGERCQAILGLAPLRGDTIEARITDRLERGEPREQAWAAWALGYRRKLKLPVRRVALLDRGEQILAARVRSGKPERVARAAVVALARTRIRRGPDASPADVQAIEHRLDEESRRRAFTVETVVALGLLRHLPAIAPLGRLLTHEQRLLALAAAWALGRMQHPRAVGPLLAALPKAAEPVRCRIVLSLAQLGVAARVSQALLVEFARKQSDFHCPKERFSLRPDRAGARVPDWIHLIPTRTRYRRVVLNCLDRVGALGDATPWLRRVAEPDSPYHREVRSLARALHRKWSRSRAQ